MTEARKRWWQQLEWTDVVFIILGVVVVLFITMEVWLPHYGAR